MPPMETATPAAEPSISDLRALLNTPAPETETTAAAPATPAAPPAGARTAPDSGTDSTEATDATRGADGKFKAAAGDEGSAPAEPDNAQKRINKAVKAQREAERQRDEALARLANPGSQPATQTAQTPAAPQTAATPAKPQADKFGTYEEYLEALSAWHIDIRVADLERKAVEKAAQNAQQKVLEANAATFTERKALYPDWDEKVNGASDIAITQVMHEFIMDSAYRADLGYYLADNPDEAERIFSLSPARQNAALGVIEASFEKTPAKAAASETKTTPAARPLPRPPSKVGGGAAPSAIDLNDPKLDMRTFKRELQKQLEA